MLPIFPCQDRQRKVWTNQLLPASLVEILVHLEPIVLSKIQCQFTLLDSNRITKSGRDVHTCKPIVEEPKSPQQEEDIEDFSWDGCIEDEGIPTIKLNRQEFNPDGQKTLYSNSISQALVSVGTTPLSAPKMKHVTSLRTEHQV